MGFYFFRKQNVIFIFLKKGYSDWVECCHNAILKKWEHDSETARRRGTLVHKVMALAVQDENKLLSKLIGDLYFFFRFGFNSFKLKLYIYIYR